MRIELKRGESVDVKINNLLVSLSYNQIMDLVAKESGLFGGLTKRKYNQSKAGSAGRYIIRYKKSCETGLHPTGAKFDKAKAEEKLLKVVESVHWDVPNGLDELSKDAIKALAMIAFSNKYVSRNTADKLTDMLATLSV